MANRIDLQVILEEIVNAAKEHGAEAARGEREFDKGLAMAYYDVLNIAKEQAELLGVDPAEIGLADIDLEKQLLRPKRKEATA
ncbi:hypothetical protein [Methylocaldum szegediense]|uniref:Transposase n=1 Tax=Methylocaldum szegediense TaxID=73780 RepID=A0ABN8X562_9GAMM|nr:hypothetical protein [Methylocaldum szegediense]CAI8883065.1 conserved protein of unknown function [Methylocaldum szegediense]